MSDPDQPFDMNNLLAQAEQMSAQLMAAQQETAARVVTGKSGGGVVQVEMTGAFEFKSVRIDPSAVDPADVEMLEDLVLAALHDAVAQVGDAGGGGLDLGGLDLGGLLGGGGLGGLLGGGDE